jgi:hypothetical protein
LLRERGKRVGGAEGGGRGFGSGPYTQNIKPPTNSASGFQSGLGKYIGVLLGEPDAVTSLVIPTRLNQCPINLEAHIKNLVIF